MTISQQLKKPFNARTMLARLEEAAQAKAAHANPTGFIERQLKRRFSASLLFENLGLEARDETVNAAGADNVVDFRVR